MDDLVDLVCSQLNLDKDYVNTWRDKPILDTLEPEPNSFMFPADPSSAGKNLHRSGLWIKLANWDTENDSGIPSPNSLRRGRITENFKVAPSGKDLQISSVFRAEIVTLPSSSESLTAVNPTISTSKSVPVIELSLIHI